MAAPWKPKSGPAILEDAVGESEASGNLFTTLLECFGDLGGVELELPARSTPARAVDLAS